MTTTDLIPHDTSREAMRVKFRILRQLGVEGRAQLTFRLCNQLRHTAMARIASRHPDWSDRQIRHELCRRTWGRELADKVFEGAADSVTEQ